MLQQVFDTNITVSIRHSYYSKFSTQIFTARIRHKYLQKGFDTNSTVSIRHNYYRNDSTQILQ